MAFALTADPQAAGGTLSGMRILLVEDDFALGRQMSDDLSREGARVLGPAPTAFYAFNLLMGPRPVDVAILDMLRHGGDVFELAAVLSERGIPMAFASGVDGQFPRRFRNVPRLQSPVNADELVQMVAMLIEPPPVHAACPPTPLPPPVAPQALGSGDRMGRAVARALLGQ